MLTKLPEIFLEVTMVSVMTVQMGFPERQLFVLGNDMKPSNQRPLRDVTIVRCDVISKPFNLLPVDRMLGRPEDALLRIIILVSDL